MSRSNAHGLTTLCPIKPGIDPQSNGRSHLFALRDVLEDLPVNDASPMAKTPNTYLCRFFVLNDLVYQGKTYRGKVIEQDELKSQYLVFTSNYHGDLKTYLRGMWQAAGDDLAKIWRHCIGFGQVKDPESFTTYILKCQVKTTFFFNGSTDQPLAEQLKSLYLKQELSNFAFENQGKSPEELQKAFREFVARTKPDQLEGPTWRAGGADAATVVIEPS